MNTKAIREAAEAAKCAYEELLLAGHSEIDEAERVFRRANNSLKQLLADPATVLALCDAADREPNIIDVIAWADGVQGALGTEYANKVDDVEASVAAAILAAVPNPPEVDDE